MDLIVKTTRLLLRPLIKDDVDLCLEHLTDPEVMKYVQEPMTHQQVIEGMPEGCQRGGGGCIGVWCIIDLAAQEKLGTAILLPLPIDLDDTDWSLVSGPEMPPGEIEVGYILKRSAWGRGVATEACCGLLKFAFEETPLQEVVAVTDPENTASQHVLTKCGLINHGQRRAYNYDGLPDFRISKARWQAL